VPLRRGHPPRRRPCFSVHPPERRRRFPAIWNASDTTAASRRRDRHAHL